jgi:hypothetical protein
MDVVSVMWLGHAVAIEMPYVRLVENYAFWP